MRLSVTDALYVVPCRAGFILSRALFRQKCGGPTLIYEYRLTEFTRHAQWQCCHHRYNIICTQNRRCGVSNWSLRQQNYLNYPTFTECFVICYVAKICRFSCGGPFCGAPVRPNMLNMPKSASECGRTYKLRLTRICSGLLGKLKQLFRGRFSVYIASKFHHNIHERRNRV